MSSDGYNHFILNPSDLVVGAPPASTPAAAPESAIQRLLGGAPELLDRISEQAADMSFRDPLDMKIGDIEHLHSDTYRDVNGVLRYHMYGPRFEWWLEHGKQVYRTMFVTVKDHISQFRYHMISKLGDRVLHEDAERLIESEIEAFRAVMDGPDKTYNRMYKQWKKLRGMILSLQEENRYLQHRITIKWFIKQVDSTFESMRELLLSMHPITGMIHKDPYNPRALFNEKYVGKRDLTERILKGKPQGQP